MSIASGAFSRQVRKIASTPATTPSTVYRTLDVLEELGFRIEQVVLETDEGLAYLARDLTLERRVLMRGLVRDGRLVRLRVTLPDVSGSLAKVAALIAEAGGNIVEIMHQRIFGTASVRSPEVEFLVETREREHTDALVALLEKNGIRVVLS